jgi:hypothetical protein
MNADLRADFPAINAVQPARRPPHLTLHCGAHAVQMGQVCAVQTPARTASWQPIPHDRLIQTVQTTLDVSNLAIGTQAHSLTHGGMRYFGLMEIHSRTTISDDYCWVLGLRNSHDKTFPAGITAGASVFVCDNLSFSGEVKLARKHTRFIVRDLPRLVQSAVGKLMERWHHQDLRLDAYRQADLSDQAAHDLVIRAFDIGVCTNRHIPRVLHEWRQPRHQEFHARNVWSLFNGFTEALKGGLLELPRRTEALHGLLDSFVGLRIAEIS